ncbi:LuxR C-terminal-related transcriptional regulator [Parafrankia sp. EUN1f]|uniref:helix-turn-helix transcriptional regulator n=1 Tax=Parafrankia sp. EUN1f TaxID=102897 RepID=UPI0001C47570|nr:LuxR C-terminal-related transcriptional regulator [Parafrankia sp. EUN1f]EFC79290.1 transcriptional regulator, LuxR family [Parafrankia sp. EUN1f]
MPAEATRKDLLELLDMVRLLHGSEAGAELPSPVLSRMAGMIGCDSASYCRVDHRTQQLVATVVEPATTDLSESSDFAAVLGQHPAFVAHRQRRLRTASSVALTDLADLRSLRNLPIYTDFYRPRETHDQLLNIVAVGRHQGTLLVFNRSRRGFSGRARELLDLASPLVCQAVAQRERLSRLTIALRDAQRHAAVADRAAGRLAALTPREREVVDQLAEGIGDREIARVLGISPRTVHKHLEQIYRKLGLQSRTAVVAVVRGTISAPHAARSSAAPAASAASTASAAAVS